MKRFFRRLIICLVLAAAVLGAVAGIWYYRSRGRDRYEELAKATLPLIRLIYQEENEWSNELHGYLEDRELKSMRGLITPLTAQHMLTIRIEEAREGDEFTYQIRSLDGSRLVENGALQELAEASGGLEQTIQFSNLVEAGEEYQLILICRRKDQTIRYYSRITYLPDGHTDEIVGMAHHFRLASCTKDMDYIVNYISPDDSMGTDDFSYVNQHSRSGMITWQGLTATVGGRIETELTELTADQAAVTLRYPLTLSAGQESHSCMVTEQYVIRWRNDVIYLLDFRRNTVEDFSCTRMKFDNGNIWLGISGGDVRKMESEDGNIEAFIYAGQLWSYRRTDSGLTSVFTFLDGDDDRGSWNHHRIQLTRVENSGDIYFMVYGYQNRGGHEGEVGLSFCRYDAERMAVDELFFVPSSLSEDVFMARMGTIAYVNDRGDLLYLLYGDTVYSIDLTSGEKAALANAAGSAAGGGGFLRNQAGSLIGWEEYDGDGFAQAIHIADLESGRMHDISAQPGEFLLLQGFMDRDVVYGVGRRSEIAVSAGEVIALPMDVIRIAEVGESILQEGEYSSPGYYIERTEIFENQIEVRRLVKVDGRYAAAENDQIFLNDREDQKDTSIVRYSDGGSFLHIALVRLDADPTRSNFATERVKYRDTEKSFIIRVDEIDDADQFLVYSGGELTGVHRRLSKAVREAYDRFGVVTDAENRRVWARFARETKKTVAVNTSVASAGTPLARCIRVLAAYEGGRSSAISAGSGEYAVVRAVSRMLPERRVLNLHGCQVGEILYYINLGHPVLAVTGEEQAVLITGYDGQNLLIFDPSVPENPEEGTGPEMTVSMAQAVEVFSRSDNQFLCAIE